MRVILTGPQLHWNQRGAVMGAPCNVNFVRFYTLWMSIMVQEVFMQTMNTGIILTISSWGFNFTL